MEEQKVLELRLEPADQKSILGNIYVGQVENLASNIRAAFVRFGDEKKGYLPLSEGENAIFTSGRKGGVSLRPGDELLVQVSRDAMKGKLAALTRKHHLERTEYKMRDRIRIRTGFHSYSI